jgi:hypothetical protein
MKQTVINILKHRFLLSACLDRTTESWHFHFTEKCVMTHYGYWRLFEEDVICSSSLDHGHSFGLGREFDAVLHITRIMRSALAGLRASPDFSFDYFGLRPKSSSRFGHGKTSHNPSRYV